MKELMIYVVGNTTWIPLFEDFGKWKREALRTKGPRQASGSQQAWWIGRPSQEREMEGWTRSTTKWIAHLSICCPPATHQALCILQSWHTMNEPGSLMWNTQVSSWHTQCAWWRSLKLMPYTIKCLRKIIPAKYVGGRKNLGQKGQCGNSCGNLVQRLDLWDWRGRNWWAK